MATNYEIKVYALLYLPILKADYFSGGFPPQSVVGNDLI